MSSKRLFSYNKNKGFTLIELMVTIAIIAILLAIGLPSFTNTITRNKLETEANNLLRDFSFSRTEAIKQGQSVSICPSSNGTSCSGGSDYGNGWIIFIDSNENGAVNGEEIIRVIENPSAAITITGSILFVCYNANGLLC
jgi:type IV fimbrial biogenesis protein FimT